MLFNRLKDTNDDILKLVYDLGDRKKNWSNYRTVCL